MGKKTSSVEVYVYEHVLSVSSSLQYATGASIPRDAISADVK